MCWRRPSATRATAIRLVERGCSTIATVEKLFRDHWADLGSVYLPGGKVPDPNSLFTNVKHAETYERILEEAEAGGGGRGQGDRARSGGPGARASSPRPSIISAAPTEVMDVSGPAAQGRAHGARTWRTWLPPSEDPIHLDYGNYRVLKPHAWTQGPVLLQMLALLRGFDLDKLSPTDADFIHTWAGVRQARLRRPRGLLRRPQVRRCADGEAVVGAYNAERRKLVGQEASMDQRPGRIEGHGGRVIVKERGRRRPAPASRPLRVSTPATVPASSMLRAAAR